MNSTAEIAADYRTLLERGWIENWKLYNTSDEACEPWWSALEELAASDGIRVRRDWSSCGAGSYFVPGLAIVQPNGEYYAVHGTGSQEKIRQEIEKRMQSDWGDALSSARARRISV